MSEVYFTSVRVKRIEADHTLPMKFNRLIEKCGLPAIVKGKKVLIKMHFGGNIGYTTIHPVFVRTLTQALKKAGAKSVCVADGSASGAELRGYTKKSIGAKLVSLFKGIKTTMPVQIGFKKMDVAELSTKMLKSDVMVVFSHVKGHGDCGFGGACKNIAMGCVPGKTRSKLHSLEGGIVWHAEKCTHCNKCIESCPNKANKFNKENNYEIFYHNCTFCRHCVLACPNAALETSGHTFADFQEGMALVVKKVLDHFKSNIFFINMLMNITIFCDCWGISTPPLVPDIGILASKDIVAIEQATLDLIKTENLQQVGLPEDKTLVEGKHLFEQIHGKDPYLIGNFLANIGAGSKDYRITETD